MSDSNITALEPIRRTETDEEYAALTALFINQTIRDFVDEQLVDAKSEYHASEEDLYNQLAFIVPPEVIATGEIDLDHWFFNMPYDAIHKARGKRIVAAMDKRNDALKEGQRLAKMRAECQQKADEARASLIEFGVISKFA